MYSLQKQTGRDIGGFWGLFKPLALESWLAILLFAIIVPAFLFLCYIILQKSDILETLSFGYGQNLFVLINAFSQQVAKINICLELIVFVKGTEFEPIYISTRVVFFCIMASNVVFFEYYSASYTSFMSVVKVASPFETVEDLYSKTNYKLGSLQGTSFKTQFNVMENSNQDISFNLYCLGRE